MKRWALPKERYYLQNFLNLKNLFKKTNIIMIIIIKIDLKLQLIHLLISRIIRR